MNQNTIALERVCPTCGNDLAGEDCADCKAIQLDAFEAEGSERFKKIDREPTSREREFFAEISHLNECLKLAERYLQDIHHALGLKGKFVFPPQDWVARLVDGAIDQPTTAKYAAKLAELVADNYLSNEESLELKEAVERRAKNTDDCS